METKHMSIWDQINQVQTLQANTIKYLKDYQQSVLQTLQYNEFLEESNYDIKDKEIAIEIAIEITKEITKEIAKEDEAIYAENSKQDNQAEEDRNEDIGISRIFKEINLGEIIGTTMNNHLNIQLQIQGQNIRLQLNKSQNFNLSNFSSFKDLKNKQQKQMFQFQDLISLIQEKVGHKINQKGIRNIIEQISVNIDTCAINRDQVQSKVISNYGECILTLSDSNVLGIRCEQLFSNRQEHEENYSYQLNNTYRSKFSRLKIANNEQRQPILKQSTKINEISLSKQKSKPNKKQNMDHKQQKENLLSVFDKKPNKLTKQLRIIKKNGTIKSNLTLFYNDSKQVQNFCISNKIYGKDKQKIYKAIKTNLTLINLQ